jgi:hypothetical protein
MEGARVRLKDGSGEGSILKKVGRRVRLQLDGVDAPKWKEADDVEIISEGTGSESSVQVVAAKSEPTLPAEPEPVDAKAQAPPPAAEEEDEEDGNGDQVADLPERAGEGTTRTRRSMSTPTVSLSADLQKEFGAVPLGTPKLSKGVSEGSADGLPGVRRRKQSAFLEAEPQRLRSTTAPMTRRSTAPMVYGATDAQLRKELKGLSSFEQSNAMECISKLGEAQARKWLSPQAVSTLTAEVFENNTEVVFMILGSAHEFVRDSAPNNDRSSSSSDDEDEEGGNKEDTETSKEDEDVPLADLRNLAAQLFADKQRQEKMDGKCKKGKALKAFKKAVRATMLIGRMSKAMKTTAEKVGAEAAETAEDDGEQGGEASGAAGGAEAGEGGGRGKAGVTGAESEPKLSSGKNVAWGPVNCRYFEYAVGSSVPNDGPSLGTMEHMHCVYDGAHALCVRWSICTVCTMEHMHCVYDGAHALCVRWSICTVCVLACTRTNPPCNSHTRMHSRALVMVASRYSMLVMVASRYILYSIHSRYSQPMLSLQA